MRLSKASLVVSLTGGLGNQLFQLAASLYLGGKRDVFLDWSGGKPRLSKTGIPEISMFNLPKNVNLLSKKKNSYLVTRALGYTLRQSTKLKSYERVPGFIFFTRFLTSILASIFYKKFVVVRPNRGVGYSEIMDQAKGNLLVGYFQTYHWMQNKVVLNELLNLKVKNPSFELERYRELAIIEKPLVVHFRLGDYKNEDLFGMLDISYYKESINKLWGTGEFGSVWIFSDEIDLALQKFEKILPKEFRQVPEISNSSAETFEVMRFGYGYVIANSTFSWWAAYLSYNREAKVYAPFPWFKKLPEPNKIIPPNWNLVPGWES
jgi:hypothetical protein